MAVVSQAIAPVVYEVGLPAEVDCAWSATLTSTLARHHRKAAGLQSSGMFKKNASTMSATTKKVDITACQFTKDSCEASFCMHSTTA